jgi:2,3-bisphosphoglycerate-independent phosphoglycerate mutase
MVQNSATPRPLLLLILDGWGYRATAPDNAISSANCPNWQRLWANCPKSLLKTDGLAVGLPEGQMGNSEVGHMNLGAGRVVYQDLTRIELAIANGEFEKNVALNQACASARRNQSTLHIFGLLSDGGVHSHQDHIFAMMKLAHQRQVQKVAVHAFLDGRDTPPRSAEASLLALQALCDALGNTQIASVSGRYFAMDRDQRWDRVAQAFAAICEADAPYHSESPHDALQAAYVRGENDEFVKPTVIGAGAKVLDDDVIVFMNFRADRAREITAAFVSPDFTGFAPTRRPALAAFVSLTEYARDLPVSAVAFAPQNLAETLPEILAAHAKTQLRIAETEKYAHVTFFFNGGVETPYPGEQRILVSSPKVATYDLQPEMSCPELTDKLVDAIDSAQFDVIICNIANPDMVGHTGIFAAAVQAAEAVDVALGRIEAAILQAGGVMLVTADHGNLEEMWDPISGQANTQHSTNPVPLVLVGRAGELRDRTLQDGALQDIAPTMLHILGLPQPAVMTGRSLLDANAHPDICG